MSKVGLAHFHARFSPAFIHFSFVFHAYIDMDVLDFTRYNRVEFLSLSSCWRHGKGEDEDEEIKQLREEIEEARTRFCFRCDSNQDDG